MLTLYYLTETYEQGNYLSKDNFNYIINFLCLYSFSLEIHTSYRIPNSSLVKPGGIPFLVILLCFRSLVIHHWQEKEIIIVPLLSHKIHPPCVCFLLFISDASSDLEGRRDQDLSLIHISEPTRLWSGSRMPSSA